MPNETFETIRCLGKWQTVPDVTINYIILVQVSQYEKLSRVQSEETKKKNGREREVLK